MSACVVCTDPCSSSSFTLIVWAAKTNQSSGKLPINGNAVLGSKGKLYYKPWSKIGTDSVPVTKIAKMAKNAKYLSILKSENVLMLLIYNAVLNNIPSGYAYYLEFWFITPFFT